MRFGLRLFLIFSLLVPMGPINSFAQKPPQDCPICGHVCCCPEMCAPKIKELKDKQSHQAARCYQDMASCRLQSAPNPTGLIHTRENLTIPNPQNGILSFFVDACRGRGFRLIEREQLFSLSTPSEIPTPPPKPTLA
jgi:hypothetical protein